MVVSLPRISIITPSFNQGDFIEETIQSVLEQGYPNLEYIIVDGGSPDGTLDIIKKYERWLSWISEPDRGQAHAINKGLCMATGEVIAYLNSDDLYQPGALFQVGNFFADHPDASWVTGKCRIIDSDNLEIRNIITWYKNFWLLVKSYSVLLVIDYISQPATFWRKSIMDEVGFFDESLYYTLDYDYSLRVGKNNRLWVINDYLASFRVHPSSKTTYSTVMQFKSDFEVANQYTSSLFLKTLHQFHNSIILAGYKLLLVREDYPIT